VLLAAMAAVDGGCAREAALLPPPLLLLLLLLSPAELFCAVAPLLRFLLLLGLLPVGRCSFGFIDQLLSRCRRASVILAEGLYAPASSVDHTCSPSASLFPVRVTLTSSSQLLLLLLLLLLVWRLSLLPPSAAAVSQSAFVKLPPASPSVKESVSDPIPLLLLLLLLLLLVSPLLLLSMPPLALLLLLLMLALAKRWG
jgi:hypothetical protein